jgi:hypothetical protein
VNWRQRFRHWRYRSLMGVAWPTLKAICEDGHDYMRPLGPVFAAGGSAYGFIACKKLGWARDCCPTDVPPGYGRATEIGRQIWRAGL